MCCLNYEQESYEYLNSITPPIGSTVKTEQGIGIVTDANFITGNLTVKPKEGEGAPYKTNRKHVKILGGHKSKRADDTKE
jgi:cell fate regulator YaaT (PSP1 superfamily)